MQLIEDLRKELEHLQLYKLECERPGRGRSSSTSVSEFNAKTREVEMEHEIKRLKQVSSKELPSNPCVPEHKSQEYPPTGAVKRPYMYFQSCSQESFIAPGKMIL